MILGDIPIETPWPGWPPREYGDGSKSLFEGSLEVKLPTVWTDEKKRSGAALRMTRYHFFVAGAVV